MNAVRPVRLLLSLMLVVVSRSAFAGELQRGIVTIHFGAGSETIALETAEIFESGLAMYGMRLPAGDTPIHVYIAATMDAFQELAGPVNVRQIEGFARSSEGVVVLRHPKLLRPGANYPAIARHELLHVLLARNTNPDHLPRWLNEGIAMLLSREGRWENPLAMARIFGGGRVIEYDDLPHVFSASGNETEFGDAYVQSLSMTQYLYRRLGPENFWLFVDALKTDPFDRALEAWLHETPGAFYEAWRGTLWRRAVVASLVTGFSLFQIGALLLVAGYWRKRRRGLRILQSWEDEEDGRAEYPEDTGPGV